jgi:hypothetical protein
MGESGLSSGLGLSNLRLLAYSTRRLLGYRLSAYAPGIRPK